MSQFQPPSQPGWGWQPEPQQQPQWQNLPVTPMLPQKPPKRRLKKRWIALAAIILIIIGIATGEHGQSPSTATVTPTAHPTHAATTAPTQAHPTSQPTHAATTQATTQSTVVQPTNGPAVLGGDLGAFVANYGQPNDHTDVSGGAYHFKRYPGSNIDFLIIQTDITDGAVYAQHVEGVAAQASDTGADGWTQQEANATCAAFLPRDAIYKSQVVTSDGYDKIYFSATLAKLFPASAFSVVTL